MSAPAFDTGTLSWVKDEIDIALERAGAALARYAAAPDQPAPLTEARGHLHQASGALILVGLAGVTHCAETVEACLADLAEAETELDVVAVAAAAGAALAALRRYLDELMAGHPDQPLRLYATYRALGLAAGQPEFSPLALFAPDLNLRPPRRDALTEPSPVRLKALRLGFARGLAKWRNGEARGLTEMKNAASNLEQGLADPAQRMPWWIALAWFEALELDGATTDVIAVDDSLASLDALFGGLIGQPQHKPPDEALLKGMLYAIAVAPPGGMQLESVRAAYRLDDLIPAADVAVETRREACRAPLATAMEEWERFSQGQAIALMRFHDVALLLAASARDSLDAELARLTAAVGEFAAWLRQQPERMDAALALDVAGALVLIEEAIETEGRRSPADEAMLATDVARQIAHLETLKRAGSASPLGRLPWRERQLQAQVAHEIAATLSQLEALLEPCFDGGKAVPEGAAYLLNQVQGAFVMLGLPQAARVAEIAALHIDNFALVANHLAALARFAESLQHGVADRTPLQPLLEAAATAVPAPTSVAAPMGTADSASAVPPASTSVAPSETDEMLGIFFEEAEEVLQTLAATQPALAANPADREALTTLRRGFHTLKGSGRMVGLNDLGEAAYAVEKLLNRRLDERVPVDGATLEAIEAGRTLFADWTAALRRAAAVPDGQPLIARCRQLLGESAEPAAPLPTAPTVSVPPAADAIAIGTLSLSPTLYQLYIDEADGHVASLRAELSATDATPSRDAIRAAHTLAGISAGTGFASVQALAHALENVLVRHSLARVAPVDTARMLIARAAGALEGMVGAIRERRAPADEPGLAASLEALVPEVLSAISALPPIATLSPLAERRQSRPADEIDPQLAPLFLEEANEQLRQLDADLRAWRMTPHDGEVGHRMARLLHTFKGSARMCGAMGIGELAHSMETRIDQALAKGGAAEPILDGLDTSLGRAHDLVAELHSGLTGGPAAVAIANAPGRTDTAAPAEASPASAAPAGEGGPAVLLRVRADLIDRLVGQAGEMATTRSRIEGEVKAIKNGLLDLADNIVRLRSQLREFEIHAETNMQSRLGGVDTHQFDPLEFDRFTRLQELTRMLAESVNDVATLQHGLLRQVDGAGEALVIQSRQQREQSHALLRARMVPFTTVDERLHRVLRQTAKELGRQANLDIRGGETPVDRNVLERMLGPLEHLLRNAVAHGIEPPETRRAAGKPELGQIVLAIGAGDNDITLRLEDDGKGLDLAAIRRRAIERGLIDATAAIDETALAELIFRSGFSTAAAVNEIAGRGVGLDVVRDEVTQLGGHVAVSGKPGQGTRFEIVLPLTLAVIPVMLVAAAGQTWAIPAALVEEARELDAEEAAARQAAGGLTRNGLRYPWHTLNGLYRLNAPAAAPTWQLLLRHAGEQIALAVEALAQNQEVVVKPLGDQLKHVPGLTGASVLPDGRVVLIVNPVALAQRVATPDTAVALASTSSAPAVKEAATVMVVDDSLTVRKITGRLLERAGYRVVTAKDGEDALEKIRAQLPAVILADIEMPRMDGFALVRALRDDAALAHLPVIMITSRIAQKHRLMAMELGVHHYLGKPYDEEELLGLIAAQVKVSA